MLSPARRPSCGRAFSWSEDIMQKNSRPTLRPMAVAVATAFLAASSILLSAAQMGSPTISGFGINAMAE